MEDPPPPPLLGSAAKPGAADKPRATSRCPLARSAFFCLSLSEMTPLPPQAVVGRNPPLLLLQLVFPVRAALVVTGATLRGSAG